MTADQLVEYPERLIAKAPDGGLSPGVVAVKLTEATAAIRQALS
jgi:hypothetical protein